MVFVKIAKVLIKPITFGSLKSIPESELDLFLLFAKSYIKLPNCCLNPIALK